MKRNDIIRKALKYMPNRLLITRSAVRARPGEPYMKRSVEFLQTFFYACNISGHGWVMI